LSQSVEDVFSSGDLPKAAETLATMRHCLSAVGEVLYSPLSLPNQAYYSTYSFSLVNVAFRLQSLLT
jgi:hypothetical protein